MIRFSGSSDDNFCWENEEGRQGDEVGCYNRPGWFRVHAPNGEELIVCGHYAPAGCPDGTWVIGVTLPAENVKLPDWPMHYGTAKNGYSPELCIEVPDGTVIFAKEDAS